MLGDGAGKVRLLGHAEHVFHLHDHHARRRAREERLHREPQVFAREARLPERADEGGPGLAALLALRFELPGREMSQCRTRAQVFLLPPPGEGRQVVRRPGDERAAWIRRRRPEFAAVALEEQQAVREDLAVVELAPEVVRNRAQVLSDHEAALAMAFKGHDAEQVVDAIAHVRALGRRHSVRHPVQARQPHHVVDAQRPGARHVRAQRGRERRVRAFAQALGGERRQAPILPAGIEVVGRGAHAHAERVEVLVGPRFGAVGRDRDGEVGIEADAHAELARARLRIAQLQVRLPLQVFVQAHE